jgi:hypothetical protein
LTEFCLYPWWTFCFSSSAFEYSALHRAHDVGLQTLQLPSDWFLEKNCPWPPDGFILSAFMFFIVVFVQVMQFFTALTSIFSTKLSTTVLTLRVMTKKSFAQASWSRLSHWSHHLCSVVFTLFQQQKSIVSLLHQLSLTSQGKF